jgi:tRNA-intron endonuclease
MKVKKLKKLKKDKTDQKHIKIPIKAILSKNSVTTENSDQARELYNQSRYGVILDSGRVIKKAKKSEPNFWTRYCVFKDIRNRGYIIKTALKFGADFRVYDRGVKPGEDHAKWIIFPVEEASTLTWYEFSAKNRVAHSTKKRLLIAVLDAENDVTYWEIKWTRP